MTGGGGRVALVTGATGALGRAVAAAFAQDGWRLGLVGTDEDRLRALAGDLGLDDERWTPAVGDLVQRDAARAAVARVEERFGQVDAVIHLVGGWAGGTPVTELDPDELATMLDQHLWTTLHVVQAAAPGMVARDWGRILAVATPFASDPGATSGGYAVAKAGQEVVLRMLAKEVAGTGVTVNVVVVKAIDAKHERETAPSARNAAWTTPEEIVAAFRFLASDEAAAVNGARLPLHGRG
ncbi:MAG: SDR family NAD(P)-dependent oxidoreductase [Candidatus Limnocylindria bacterium]